MKPKSLTVCVTRKISDKMRLDWLSDWKNFGDILAPMPYRIVGGGPGWATWMGSDFAKQFKSLRQTVDHDIRASKRRGGR